MYIDIHTTSMSSIGLLVLKQGRNNSGHSCYQYMLLPVQQNWPAPPQFAHSRTTSSNHSTNTARNQLPTLAFELPAESNDVSLRMVHTPPAKDARSCP